MNVKEASPGYKQKGRPSNVLKCVRSGFVGRIAYQAFGESCTTLSVMNTGPVQEQELDQLAACIDLPNGRKVTALIIQGVINSYRPQFLNSSQGDGLNAIQEFECTPDSVPKIINAVDVLKGCISDDFVFQPENIAESVYGLAGIEWLLRHYDDLTVNNKTNGIKRRIHDYVADVFWRLVGKDKIYAEHVAEAISACSQTLGEMDDPGARKLLDAIDYFSETRPRHQKFGLPRETSAQKEIKITALETFADCITKYSYPNLPGPVREQLSEALIYSLSRREFVDELIRNLPSSKNSDRENGPVRILLNALNNFLNKQSALHLDTPEVKELHTQLVLRLFEQGT